MPLYENGENGFVGNSVTCHAPAPGNDKKTHKFDKSQNGKKE